MNLTGSLNQFLAGAIGTTSSHPLFCIDIVLHNQNDGNTPHVYSDGQPVKGEIFLHTSNGKLSDASIHSVNIELIGHLEISHCKNPMDMNFCFLQKSLPCYLNKGIPFLFKGPDLPYNTYKGSRANIKYLLRCKVLKESSIVCTKECELTVINEIQSPPSKPIKTEVGIDNCLNIEIRLDRNVIDLNESILGTVCFSTVRLPIKHMELDILRSEIVGGVCPDTDQRSSADGKLDGNLPQDTQVLFRYELVDGTPAKMETIPIRLHLRNVPVGPTMIDVVNNLTVRYYVSVVMFDVNDRKYFKKQEVVFYKGADAIDATQLALALSEEYNNQGIMTR